jgi:hypothetical protein
MTLIKLTECFPEYQEITLLNYLVILLWIVVIDVDLVCRFFSGPD